jgi:ubiquinol-cytochrome c reductase cytochrome b subunit
LLWYFAVLALLPHGTETYAIVGAPGIAATCLLVLPLIFNRGQRAPSRRPWAVASVVLIITGVGALWMEGVRSPWSPDFNARALPPMVVHAADAEVAQGAVLFHDKGCEYCHAVGGIGGNRGPELGSVADRMTQQQMTLRILNGANNMPSFASTLKPGEVSVIVAFLASRHLADSAADNNQH